MPLVRMSFAEARKRAAKKPVDWARIDAMTDEDIARQIAEDPDVAPDASEALARGEFVRLHIVDVFGLRTGMGLSHKQFAKRFGLDPHEVKEWEAMEGVPDEAIRTYLRVIEREPEAIARVVAAIRAEQREPADGKVTCRIPYLSTSPCSSFQDRPRYPRAGPCLDGLDRTLGEHFALLCSTRARAPRTNAI